MAEVESAEAAQETGPAAVCPEAGEPLMAVFPALGQRLAEKNGLNGACDLLLNFLRKEYRTIRAAVCLLHKDSGLFIFGRSIGCLSEGEAPGPDCIGPDLTGRVFQTGQPVIIGSSDSEPVFLNQTKTAGGETGQDRTFVGVPIVMGGMVLGSISSEGFFPGKSALARYVETLRLMADLMAPAAKLYLVEKIDKVQWERRVRSLAVELGRLKERYCPIGLVGSSEAIQEVYYLIQKVAARKTTVLFLGEPGVGKETAANALHYYSKTSGPFVTFNCSGLAESQAEGELFGHEKTSFNGAAICKGLLETADGGTVFFDHVDRLPLGVQTKLLRVLQEHCIERVGGSASVKVDIRVIAAADRDLREMVRLGRFLEDLYYRLNVFPITVPPLREREDDVIVLAKHFLARFAEETGQAITGFAPTTAELLKACPWPGNVRELENVIRRAVIMAQGSVISPHDLPLSVSTPEFLKTQKPDSLENRLAGLERQMLTEALRINRGNISAAAKELGLTRRSMSLKMKRLNLIYRDFRTPRLKESGLS